MAFSTLLPSSTLAVTLLSIVGLVLYISISCFINYRKLSQFDGPPLAAISGLWLWKQSLYKRAHVAQAEALQKYGMAGHFTVVVATQLTNPFHRLSRAYWTEYACDR